MIMLGNVRKDLKVYMEGMEEGKETLTKECYWISESKRVVRSKHVLQEEGQKEGDLQFGQK